MPAGSVSGSRNQDPRRTQSRGLFSMTPLWFWTHRLAIRLFPGAARRYRDSKRLPLFCPALPFCTATDSIDSCMSTWLCRRDDDIATGGLAKSRPWTRLRPDATRGRSVSQFDSAVGSLNFHQFCTLPSFASKGMKEKRETDTAGRTMVERGRLDRDDAL